MAEPAVRQHRQQTARQSRRETPFFVAGGRERNAQNNESKNSGSQRKLILLKQKIEDKSQEQKAHKQSSEIVEGTQNAVSVDATLQQSSQENTVRVQEMSEAEPRPFDAAQFEASIIKSVEKVIPKTKEEFERDPTSNARMQTANREMSSTLDTEQSSVTGEIEQAGSAPVGAENILIHQPEDMIIDEIGAVPQIGEAGIAPSLHTEEETDLSAESQEIDASLEESGVTEAMLQNGNEPSFSAAMGLKQESQSRAENTRTDYLAEANPVLQASIDSTEQRTASGVAQMYGVRSAQLATLQTGQDSSRVNEEQVRTRVAQDLDAIYERTRLEVEGKLEILATAVRSRFETALTTANATFEANVRERTKTGFWESIKRWASGTPKDMEQIFQEEQRNFINALRPVVREIAELMESELNATMAIIDTGKQEMQTYWDNQDEETQRIAGDLFAAAGERYTALEQQVNETNSQLQDDITEQFTAAVNSLRETFDRIKEENKNWLERARDAVVGVIDAIIEMKNMLLSILEEAAETVVVIINDPIGFLTNLLNAIRTGFVNFVTNIWTYIKEGLIAWLLGNMPPGIVFPETWNLKGIFTFVASIIGLTWENIKDRAIRKFGPKVVAGLETAFEVFVIIKEQGIAGLWEYIKEKLINIKDQVLGAIQEMLITKVIQAGITWVISLFNPAGAFLKACKMIYDVIVWFINNARRLLELVRSIVSSVAMIAAGNISAAAKFVEQSLAKTVPIVIGFLAGLLGIGDLSARVQKIIDKIREPVNKAIDWVLDKAKSIAQRLMAAGKKGVETIAGWLGIKKSYRSKDGNSHELFFEERGGSAVLMRASEVPTTFEAYFAKIKSEYSEHPSFRDIEDVYTDIRNNMGEYNSFKSQKVSENMNKLAILLSALSDNVNDEFNIFFPEHSGVSYTTYSQTLPNGDTSVDGKKIEISYLSLRVGSLEGSHASHKSKLYKHIKSRIGSNVLIRGHLLNHYLGGAGNTAENIAPIAKVTNDEMERPIKNKATERAAKIKLLSGGVFDYSVDINYVKSNKLKAFVPSSIKMEIVERNYNHENKNRDEMIKSGNWIEGKKTKRTIRTAKKELEKLVAP